MSAGSTDTDQTGLQEVACSESVWSWVWVHQFVSSTIVITERDERGENIFFF